MIHFHAFSDVGALQSKLAAETEKILRDALAQRQEASLIVSGGKSPIGFFAKLAAVDLAWDRVHVSLADERWVNPASIDSNERLVREHLLTNRAAHAKFLPLMSSHATAAEALVSRTRELLSMPRPFDCVVLGMGEDGHTASLFPGDASLPSALDAEAQPALVAVTKPPHPAAPYARISLNLAAILHARQVVLMISGEAKRAVFEAARDGAPPTQYPIAAVLGQNRVRVEVYYSP
jgi:6-phosphogluconolactonase